MAAQDRDVSSFHCSSMTLYEVQGDGFCLQTLHTREKPPHVTGAVIRMRIDRDFRGNESDVVYLPASPVHVGMFIDTLSAVCDVDIPYTSMSSRRRGEAFIEKVASAEYEGFLFSRRSATPGLVTLSVPHHRRVDPTTSLHVGLQANRPWMTLFTDAYRHITSLDKKMSAERVAVSSGSSG